MANGCILLVEACSKIAVLLMRVKLMCARSALQGTTLFRCQDANDLSATTQTGLSTDQEMADLFRKMLM